MGYIPSVSWFVCEKCQPLTLTGTSTQDFRIVRDDPAKAMLAEVHAAGNDKGVDIDGFRELKFLQPGPTPCLLGAPHITKVTGPQNQDGDSRSKSAGFAPEAFPRQGFSGIGWLVEPSQHDFPAVPETVILANLVMHDHRMVSANVPDPINSTVEYEFSMPVEITQIEVIQHRNGINALHAWLTDKPGDYSSGDLGIATRPWPQTANVIPEGQADVYTFADISPHPVGRFLKVT